MAPKKKVAQKPPPSEDEDDDDDDDEEEEQPPPKPKAKAKPKAKGKAKAKPKPESEDEEEEASAEATEKPSEAAAEEKAEEAPADSPDEPAAPAAAPADPDEAVEEAPADAADPPVEPAAAQPDPVEHEPGPDEQEAGGDRPVPPIEVDGEAIAGEAEGGGAGPASARSAGQATAPVSARSAAAPVSARSAAAPASARSQAASAASPARGLGPGPGDASPGMVQVSELADAPVTTVDINMGHRAATELGRTHDTTAKVLQTIQEAIASIQGSAAAVPDDTTRGVLQQKQSQLEKHAAELQGILSSLAAQSPGARPPASLTGPELSAAKSENFTDPQLRGMVQGLEAVQMPTMPRGDGEEEEEPDQAAIAPEAVVPEQPRPSTADTEMELAQAVDNVKRVRRQVQCYTQGMDIEEGVEAPRYETEDAERDIQELRRVRRQLRYMFGGMISNLPFANGQGLPGLAQGAVDLQEETPPPSSYGQPKVAPIAGDHSTKHAMGATGERFPEEASVTSEADRRQLDSKEEKRRRRHRERSDRGKTRDRDRREESDARHTKKDRRPEIRRDYGADAGTSWADEIVKATADPMNQWDFGGGYQAPRRGRQEQPRQRGHGADEGLMTPANRSKDVYMKAQERADEVMRMERNRSRPV